MAFVLSGCTIHRMDIQTRYLSRENLASYHVLTPDPQLDNPVIGQRILVQWTFPSRVAKACELELYIKMRYRNHEEKELFIPIYKDKKSYIRGDYQYNLLNEDYCRTGGVLTYKAQIWDKDCLIAEWIHPLWTELIIFEAPT